VRGPKQIELEISEPVARYVLALLDVDDYEHSPNHYETAQLRSRLQEQLTQAQHIVPPTAASVASDSETSPARAVVEQSKTSVVAMSPEQILTVIEQMHVCYDYCAVWKEPAQQETGADDIEAQR
jgi:hypothetical protein